MRFSSVAVKQRVVLDRITIDAAKSYASSGYSMRRVGDTRSARAMPRVTASSPNR